MKLFTVLITVLLFSFQFNPVQAQQDINESVVIGKVTRRWIVHLPTNYNPNTQYPLFINMHGFTSNGNQQMSYSGFNEIANEKGAIAVYPNGVDKRWNSGINFGIESDIDDVGFLSMLIDRMILLYNADPIKVYSIGYSAGGFMSYRMACERANRIAAIGPVVASITNSTYETCVPARPFPIIAFNGTSDALTSFGGIAGNFPAIKDIMAFWSQKNGCDINPDTTAVPNTNTTDLCTATKIEYKNCSDGVQQILYRINGGGHTWPGSTFPGVGSTNKDISANQEIWDFCSQYVVPEIYRCESPQNLSAVASSETETTYNFSWDQQVGTPFYNFALIDTANNIVFTDSLSVNQLNVEISDPSLYRWSVASRCNSGYVSWAKAQAVEAVPTSIKNKISALLSIYPNPAQNTINISNNSSINAKDLVIFDTYGRVQKANISANNQQISLDISNLTAGAYFIQMGNSSGSFIKLP